MRKGGTKRQLVVRLKAADRRRIAAMLRGGIEPVRVIKRAQVLRLLDQGTGPPQIADAVGVSPQTVRDVGWRYLGEGLDRALNEKPRPGHQPALSPEQAQRIRGHGLRPASRGPGPLECAADRRGGQEAPSRRQHRPGEHSGAAEAA
jgi:hypothetical protein